MKFSIPIPDQVEVQLVGPELTLIGPTVTKKWSGNKYFKMNLCDGHIVLTPHDENDCDNNLDQHDLDACSFNECRVIEWLIEDVR